MATKKGAAGDWRKSPICQLLVKIDRILHNVMLFFSQLALIAMIIIVTMTVVMRYCFNTGISWAEEVPRLLILVFALIFLRFIDKLRLSWLTVLFGYLLQFLDNHILQLAMAA